MAEPVATYLAIKARDRIVDKALELIAGKAGEWATRNTPLGRPIEQLGSSNGAHRRHSVSSAWKQPQVIKEPYWQRSRRW